jgi:hypothetical protein
VLVEVFGVDHGSSICRPRFLGIGPT